MRIEKTDKEFRPVTIILESPEELMFMWHRMNLSEHDIEEASREYTHVPFNGVRDGILGLRIFGSVDDELIRLGLKKS